MRPVTFLLVAMASGWLCPAPVWATPQTSCPIELLVGKVERIDGDPADIHLFRGGHEVAMTPNACIIYGDRLQAGIRATVYIITAEGRRHVGGDFDPEWDVPAPRGTISPSASAYLGSLFGGLTKKTPAQGAYIISRGPENCPPPATDPPPLEVLDRLSDRTQMIGADLGTIVVAWRPSTPPHDVHLRLIGADGTTIVEGHSCLDAHVALPLGAGRLRPDDHLTLDIVDALGETMRYSLVVIRPAELTQAPVPMPEEWLNAAWRLATEPPDVRLDAISRIEMAPEDALGARLILQAVWADQPF
jgi:hypothetical protein